MKTARRIIAGGLFVIAALVALVAFWSFGVTPIMKSGADNIRDGIGIVGFLFWLVISSFWITTAVPLIVGLVTAPLWIPAYLILPKEDRQ